MHRCRLAVSCWCALAVVAWCARVRAQDEPELTPEELAEIEAVTGDDAAAIAESREQQPGSGGVSAVLQALNPDISFIVDVALAAFSDEAGNLQAGAHDPSQNGFNLQQVELAIGKAVDPFFRVDGNIVFGEFGVEIEEMYATTLSLPWNLQLRVGQFLTRFGRLNATHPHTWDFVDQPLILGRYFGGESNRGLGAELSYLTPLPWYVEVVGSVTNPIGEATARSFLGGSGLSIESPLDFQGTLAVKQFFELGDDWSLLWGLSAANGPNATGHDNRTDIYGTDVYLKYRPISEGSYTIVALQAEWLMRRRQVPDDLMWDHGGYVYGFWRFSKRWGVAARYELGAASRDEDGDRVGDDLDPQWVDDRHRVSASATLWPTEFSRVRLQGSVDAPG